MFHLQRSEAVDGKQRATVGIWFRFAATLAAVLLAPWTFRVLLMVEEAGTAPAASVARGFVSDLAVALLFASVVVVIGRVARRDRCDHRDP